MSERFLDIVLISIIAITAIISSATFDIAHVVMPAGDTFNFINASEALKELTYIKDERRLPTYPLLIMIGSFFTDSLTSANIVALIAGVSIPIFIYVLGRKMGIHPLPTGITAVLATIEPHFTVIGARPLSDGLFVAVLLLLLILCFNFSSKPTYTKAVVYGFIVALFILIRPEGILFAGLLLLYLLITTRKDWKIFAVLILSTILFLAPWLVINLRLYGTVWHHAYDDQISGSQDSWGASTTGEILKRSITLAKEGHWLAMWEIPSSALEEAKSGDIDLSAFSLIKSNGMWWLSTLAWIGLIVMIRNWKVYGFILIVYCLEFLIVSWWGPTFRFTSFIIPLWFFAIAACLHTLFFAPSSLLRQKNQLLGHVTALILVIYVFAPQVQDFGRISYSRASDNYGTNIALLNALYYTNNLQSEDIAVLEVNGITQAFLKKRLVDLSSPEKINTSSHPTAAKYILLKEPIHLEDHPWIHRLRLRRVQYFPHSLEGDASFSLYEIDSGSGG